MTAYSPQLTGHDGICYRISYADVAGGYGGWFLIVVQGDDFAEDSDFNPANGPSIATAEVTTGNALRVAALAQINARLDRLLGAGHSSKWQALLVQGVTAAVIDDDWPA